MTKSRIEQPHTNADSEHSASLEGMADELVALIEKFETVLSQGHVPQAFASRLANIRAHLEDLFVD